MANMSNVTIAIAGGRTGGHLFPALAVAKSLIEMNKDINLYMIGTADGVESKIVPDAGYRFYAVPAIPLRRNLSIKNLAIPFVLAAGAIKSFQIFRKTKTSAVFATGGFICVPVLIAALLGRVSIFMQEQNSYPGLTTRLFAKYAKSIFAAYPAVKEYLHPDSKVVQTGNPLRPGFEIGDRNETVNFFGLDPDRKTLLIFGGSQGAEAINRLIADSLERFSQRKDIQIVWQTGNSEFNQYKQRFEDSGASGVVFPFIVRMDLAYACADLVISRAGAMTLAELAAAGKPAILIPYPHAAEDHQKYNAKLVADKKAAVLIRQEDMVESDLIGKALDLLGDAEKLTAMAESSRKLYTPGASDAIARAILSEVNK